MKRSIGVGLIGFGMAGELFHAPFIQAVDGLVLKKIRTGNEERAQKALSQYADIEVVNDNEAIFSDDSIELVVIATSNTSHFELAKQALEAGKNVVVDKPFVIHSADADALIRLAEDRGLLLSVYQNRRWDGDSMTVQALVEKNKVGKVTELEMHMDRFRPHLKAGAWREEDLPGSGILYDLGAHMIDLALVLFGRPKYVWADIGMERAGSKAVDYFDLLLKYSSGLRVKIGGCMLAAQPRPRFILNGDKGSYVKYGVDPQEDALKAGKRPWDLIDWGREEETSNGILKYQNEEGELVGKIIKTLDGDYRKFYENIYGALTGTAALKVRPEESRNVIRIIELAMESSEMEKKIELNYQVNNIKY